MLMYHSLLLLLLNIGAIEAELLLILLTEYLVEFVAELVELFGPAVRVQTTVGET